MDSHRPQAVCIVMPAFNSRPAIVQTIRGVIPAGLPIIVVDDGSTDGTGEALREIDGIEVIRFDQNRGKGEAIKRGLLRAQQRGFTHAVTMDSDGQHLPEDLPALLQAARRQPRSIVLGVRDLGGAGPQRKSRLLRLNSDFWTWLETGVWAGDSQSGFRVYPLHAVTRLQIDGSRYDFEVEVLVKAIWSGAGVARVPVRVRYDTGCPSRFRPIADFLLVAKLNCRLLTARLFVPAPLRAITVRRAYRRRPWGWRWRWMMRHCAMSDVDRPARFAACVGVGVAMGILPIWGFQMLAAFFVAQRLGLNPLVAVAASNISFGGVAAVIIALSAWMGHLLLHGGGVSFWEMPRGLGEVGERLMEYVVGAVALAGAAGLLLGAVAYGAAWMVRWARQRQRNASIHARV